MGAFDTYVYNMQDPDDDCVAWKPELAQILNDGNCFDVLLDAYQEAQQRIAELERANAAQDDHFNQQQDRIDVLERRNQPGADGYDDWYVHSADDGEYLKADDVIEAIRAAGIKVKES
ncbi:hypothetical protein DN081_24910 [Salmonella enterica subsp. enterica]|nr:hypothetical protein [Salmonella enterica subsp. enterica serovar Bispebjerg]